MKLNGIIGKGTGKLGSSVFAISGGEQVVREYNPVVSNPNTEAQIAQRAKLKLMSQLGAALAPALGFAKMGLVSARNQFVSKNIGLCTFENDNAVIEFKDIKLTPSNVAFPALSVSAGSGNVLEVALEEAASADIKRVAYFVYERVQDGQLKYVASKVVSAAGVNNTFPTTFNAGSGQIVVYAYGVKDNNAKATIRYNDYAIGDGGEVSDERAILVVESLFRTSAYGLTDTSAVLYSLV